MHGFEPKAGRFALRALLALAVSSSALAQGTKPSADPPPPIQIQSATATSPEAPLYGRVEIEIALTATFDNPFDPNQIAVDAEVTAPSGSTYTQPGFFYRPFTRNLANGREALAPAGNPSWRVRLALTEVGQHKVVITAKDKTGTAKSNEILVTATQAASHGFIKASERDFHFFEYSDGAPFFTIGATLQAHNGLVDLETWIPKLQSSGGNTARLILGPENMPFAITTKGSGAAKMDLANSWRLDQAMDLMEKSNISPILCLDNFNQLRQRDYDPRWPTNPFNKDNGGPLNTDTEFWKNPIAGKLYNDKLRYMIARYGAYANLLGWELWRDIDLVHGYDPDLVRPWIEKRTQFIKGLDPYGHLVTISYADPLGERSIDHLPGIDFVQSHVYNFPDLVPPTTLQQYRKAGYGKPHIVTEVSADASSDKSKLDTNGLQIHDPMWSSIASGAAGAAMPWWWDTYVFPKRMYNRFGALANFVKGIDWPGQNFRPATPVFRFQAPPKEPIYRDLMIENGPVSFGNTEYNLPRHVRIYPKGVEYGLPVSGILHGQRLHPSKFNPVRFTIDTKRSTQFDLIVGDVSGLGGASIQIKLDGEVVMGLDLADPDGLSNDEVITKYRGTYSLKIPAGHHELIVADVGNDWVKANFRFRDLLPRTSPPLVGFCLAGDTTTIAWVRHADRTWDRIESQKRSVLPCPPSTMTIQGIIAGAWRADLWDTWTGKLIKTIRVTVGSDGMGVINLPEISADIAVKLTKIAAKPAKPAKKQ